MLTPLESLARKLTALGVPYERDEDRALHYLTSDGVVVVVPDGVATLLAVSLEVDPDAVGEIRVDRLSMPMRDDREQDA
jgi:hypothetical protein